MHVPAREDLPASERLMLAILRTDAEEARRIIDDLAPDAAAAAFVDCCQAHNLVAFLFDCCSRMMLLETLSNLKYKDRGSCLKLIKRDVGIAIARYERLNATFRQLNQSFLQAGLHPVWIKGPVMARTFYAQPYFRLSNDFDLLLRPDEYRTVVESLIRNGCRPIWDDPGHCHQFGVGPTGSLDKLSISPSAEIERWHNLSLVHPTGLHIEIKSDPLDTGLRMRELERFHNDCQWLSFEDQKFLAPSLIDHLMLEITHLHKHFFVGWAWLYDIHLLASELNRTPSSWNELVRRCRLEGVSTAAWAVLQLVLDWLDTDVPNNVIEQLAPPSCNVAARLLTFTADPEFLWNSSSILDLLQNACFLGDRKRKLEVLAACFFPDAKFLSDYYCNGAAVSPLRMPILLIIHWLIVVLPGGISRRLFGRFIFPSSVCDR